MNRGLILGLLLAVGAGVALRCPRLSERPMHTDEAVNAIKFRSLWEQGLFRYDPSEHHGPSLYYATWLWRKAAGPAKFVDFDEASFRAVTVLFGVGLIFLLPLVADGLGRGATVCAALLMAVSPAMVFYSRDFIHETPLVFFTFLAIAAGWRYFVNRSVLWAALCGAAVGLMQSTKETFVLAVAAAVMALAINSRWSRPGSRGAGMMVAGMMVERSAGRVNESTSPFRRRHLAVALVAWLALVLLLFTSFLTHWRGLVDSARTYQFWLSRAGGDSPHAHAWDFYLTRLAWFQADAGPLWTEGFIGALALIGIFVAFTRRGGGDSNADFVRFTALYTIILATIYSVIRYKTPWCALSFWQGVILLAGVGTAALWQRARQGWARWGLALVLFTGLSHLAAQAWRAGVTYSADSRNPYAYAQTSADLMELIARVNALAQASPERHHMLVKVVAPEDDYWPLPWYLREFDQTGWWSGIPEDLAAPVVITSARLKTSLDVDGGYVMAGMFKLRPGVFLQLYVQSDLWQHFLSERRQ